MSRCGCDSHVLKLLMIYKYIAQPTVCEGKSVDLVRYPTTLAPLTFIPVTVTALCAENAHRASCSSLSVFCTQSGDWTGSVPQCQCDDGFHLVTLGDRKQMCQLQCKNSSMMVMAPPIHLGAWSMAIISMMVMKFISLPVMVSQSIVYLSFSN